MNECIAADHGSHIYQHNPSGALRTFFHKLCKFLRQGPVIMVFVFDGPNRPSFKHGKKIDTQKIPKWCKPCKEIIEAFGFYWRDAPGEAEAELAVMNQLNIIDAVLTNDSDCLIFGAQCVLRSLPKSADQYQLYSLDVMENMPEVSLSRGGLLLVALLAKSDYSDGLIDCGAPTAAILARGGFGDRIIHAFNKLEDIKLDCELQNISATIQNELRYNISNLFNCLHPRLASNLANSDCLSQGKVLSFLKPVLSADLNTLSSTQTSNWLVNDPALPRISRFCTGALCWPPEEVPNNVKNILWPGVILRMLISPLLMYDSESGRSCRTPRLQMNILKLSVKARRGKAGKWARIDVSVNDFIKRLQLGTGNTASGIHKTKVWIPIEYLSEPILPRSASMPTSTLHQSSRVKDSDEDIKSDSESDIEFVSGPFPVAGPSHIHQQSPVKSHISSDSEIEFPVSVPLTKRRKLSSPEVIVISD
ncbi:PIN domain-like protein [Pholiota conissans]|uniref:PIN domain-like protein n=1 Tax=Pholiota conissans TaxID=109636 RepID=A0A9P6CRU2_9AGAR|nr:PIN domain-like protein [Pholiota conissans]